MRDYDLLTRRQKQIASRLKNPVTIGKTILQSQIDQVTGDLDSDRRTASVYMLNHYQVKTDDPLEYAPVCYMSMANMMPLLMTTYDFDRLCVVNRVEALASIRYSMALQRIQEATKSLSDDDKKPIEDGLAIVLEGKVEKIVIPARDWQERTAREALLKMRKVDFFRELFSLMSRALGVSFKKIVNQLEAFHSDYSKALTEEVARLGLTGIDATQTRINAETKANLKEFANQLKYALHNEPQQFKSTARKWLSLYLQRER